MAINDILNRTPINVMNGDTPGKAQKLMERLRIESEKLSTGSKYSSLAELEEAGLSKEYSNLHQILVADKNFRPVIIFAENRLESKLEALRDLRYIVTEIQNTDNGNQDVCEEIVNDALDKIKNILNKKDKNEYIFGGKMNTTKPIKGDLTQLDENNFTNVVAKRNLIKISDNISVDVNKITASDISSSIEALNNYKNHRQGAEVNDLFKAATEKLFSLEQEISNDLTKIKEAKKKNKNIISEAKKSAKRNFASDRIKISEQMQFFKGSFFANLAISEFKASILNKIISSA